MTDTIMWAAIDTLEFTATPGEIAADGFANTGPCLHTSAGSYGCCIEAVTLDELEKKLSELLARVRVAAGRSDTGGFEISLDYEADDHIWYAIDALTADRAARRAGLPPTPLCVEVIPSDGPHYDALLLGRTLQHVKGKADDVEWDPDEWDPVGDPFPIDLQTINRIHVY